MKYEQIMYDVDDRIATITLNRPEALNAWTPLMMEEILDALDRADNDDEVRVVIFTGAGRAYCAGADLSGGGFRKSDTAFRDSAGQATLRMYNMKKPIIGAINGNAVGVGITMTLAMDVRIASESAKKIGFVFNRRGVVPEGCSTFFLPRIIGISKASELILTGRLFDAREGMEMGIFSRVVPADELLPTARKIAREIADNTSAVSTALGTAASLEDALRNAAYEHAHSGIQELRLHAQFRRCKRRRQVVHGKASCSLRHETEYRHARLLPLVERTTLYRMILRSLFRS